MIIGRVLVKIRLGTRALKITSDFGARRIQPWRSNTCPSHSIRKIDDGGDQAQSKSRARCGAALIDAVEAVDHFLALVRWNPVPVVGDGDVDVAVRFPE